MRSAHLPPPPGRVGCSLPRCEQAGKLVGHWLGLCSLGPRHSLVSRARRAHHHHHVGPGIPGGGSAPRRDPRVWVVACAGVAACGGTHPAQAQPRVACGPHPPPSWNFSGCNSSSQLGARLLALARRLFLVALSRGLFTLSFSYFCIAVRGASYDGGVRARGKLVRPPYSA